MNDEPTVPWSHCRQFLGRAKCSVLGHFLNFILNTDYCTRIRNDSKAVRIPIPNIGILDYEVMRESAKALEKRSGNRSESSTYAVTNSPSASEHLATGLFGITLHCKNGLESDNLLTIVSYNNA